MKQIIRSMWMLDHKSTDIFLQSWMYYLWNSNTDYYYIYGWTLWHQMIEDCDK